MTDSPFGNPDVDVITAGGDEIRTVTQPSIVDAVLDLDAFLSGDVRLAERTYRFCTRPDLEAKMEALNAELATFFDAEGRLRPVTDASLGDGVRSADVVSAEIEELTAEYTAAFRSGRMRQLDQDEWTEFLAAHKKALDGPPPYPPEFYEDLIVRTAIAPKFTADQVRKLRKHTGHAVFQELCDVAWRVNTESGVSVPKSLLSSAVQRQQGRG